MSNRLKILLQRQHILLTYFKTLSVGQVKGSNPPPPAQQKDALPTELTGRRNKRGFGNWGISIRYYPTFSWGIFSHMTCSDQSGASENI